jgi:thiosulfate/3-mercaptopyruvate sulfurtransferase
MNSNTKIISTSEVFDSLRENSAQIIDVRPVHCYNGWRYQNEMRGGHIRGARSVPVKWFKNDNWPQLIAAKGIVPQKKIIVYGYDAESVEKAASLLNNAGYGNINMYLDFLNQWSENPEMPMSQLERYQQLVPSRWLNDLINCRKAQDFTNSKFKLCHTYYHDKKAYNDGHIPEAIAVDTNLFESPETWNRRSPSEIKQALEQTGITTDTTVIIYGRDLIAGPDEQYPGSKAGHLSAMRIAMIMLYAGVRDVRILNGGMQSWIDEGFTVSTEAFKKKSVDDFGASVPQHPEYFVDLQEAEKIIKSDNEILACICSRPEYFGETSGYNYIEKKGHIPGSVFVESGSDAYHMEQYRNQDQTTREYHEIEHHWYNCGLSMDKRTAFFCGTGWRASEAFINAWLMGWKKIAVFDGGWFEWSRKKR